MFIVQNAETRDRVALGRVHCHRPSVGLPRGVPGVLTDLSREDHVRHESIDMNEFWGGGLVSSSDTRQRISRRRLHQSSSLIVIDQAL